MDKETHVFLRDVYDHTIQIIETVETFRDMLSGMQDTFLTSISNRMNEVMKGMNFKFMPELGWRYGYFAVWVLMAALALGMLALFRKKRWL